MRKTIVLKVDPQSPDKKAIAAAAKAVREGSLVAFPTETVYGLGANLRNKKAVDRLYAVKKRPRSKPFTVHIASLARIKDMGCKVTKDARRLADKFWPGPLTIILRSAKNAKIGFRMPDHKVALALIRGSGVPVIAPSANISGKRPPTNARDVLRELDGKVDILLDGGPTEVGIESTVVDLAVTPPKVLREGAISREKINKVITKEKRYRFV